MFALTGALISGILFKVLVSLGLSTLTYVGFDAFLNFVLSYVQTSIMSGSFPDIALNLMGLFGFDKAVNLIISAYSARIAMASLSKLRLS